MKDLIQELIPHAPQMGLYVAPNVPDAKRRNALSDYGTEMPPGDVIALYDATLTGNAKDGALFAADRFIFQNNDLEATQTVRYRDLIGVKVKRRLLGGRKVVLDVNRGRATFQLTMDFSGATDAANHVARFLEEAIHRSAQADMAGGAPVDPADEHRGTDMEAVRSALMDLRTKGQLTSRDFRRLMDVLASGGDA
jgi:hypothetical protein